MNKKLVTLAVAAAIAAPAAAMADATMYGKLHVSVDYADVKSRLDEDESTFKGWGLNGQGMIPGVHPSNRVGIKGSEDLGGGLKAIYQVELGVTLADSDYDINNGDKGDGLNMRNSFVGLAGNWGTFLVGRHDTPLKISTGALDLFADTMADYNGTVGFHDVRADNAIAYISPNWSGFQFAGAVVPGGGSTVTGQKNIDSDSIAAGWGLAGIYKNGPFYASIAYELFGKELAGTASTEVGTEGDLFADNMMMTADGLAPVSGYVEVMDPDTGMGTGEYEAAPGVTTVHTVRDKEYKKWRVGLGLLDWNGFTLTGIYEDQKNVPSAGGVFVHDNERKLWQVQAGYAFGNNMVKAMYGQVDRDLGDQFAGSVAATIRKLQDADRSTWALAFDHNFSKRTRAYIVYTDVDDDAAFDNDWSGVSLGMIHKF